MDYARIIRIIEDGGAEFLRLQDDSVVFFDRETGRELSLPTSAVTSENVRLALENAREQVAETPPPVATDTDAVLYETVFSHLTSMFDPETAKVIAGKLGLRIR